MEPCNIFPSAIWKGHFTGYLTKLEQRSLNFLKDPKTNISALMEGGISSGPDLEPPHEWEEAKEFMNWTADFCNKVWIDWNYLNMPWEQIEQTSWVNLFPQNGYAGEHSHCRDCLVIVLYIKKAVGTIGGNLEINNPLFYHWEGSPRADGHYWEEIEVEAGDVVIIPGWMLHRTTPNKSSEDRVTMSVNLNVISTLPSHLTRRFDAAVEYLNQEETNNRITFR